MFEGSFLVAWSKSLTNFESLSSPDIPLVYTVDHVVELFDEISDRAKEITCKARRIH